MLRRGYLDAQVGALEEGMDAQAGQERLSAALQTAETTDLKSMPPNFQRAMQSGSRNMLLEAATWLSVRDAAGGLRVCRGLRRLLPRAVRSVSVSSLNCTGNVDDAVVVAVAQQFRWVEAWNFSNGKLQHLASATVITVAMHASVNLRSVNLGGLNCIEDAAVLALVDHCPNIKEIDLTTCRKLTDSAVVRLVNCYSGLTSLKLAQCFKLTDASVVAFARTCPGLTEVDLHGIKHMTGLPPSLCLLTILDSTQGLCTFPLLQTSRFWHLQRTARA